MVTSLGTLWLEIDNAQAPVTAANFLRYVKDGFYDGTIFHRVIPRFMVQGGGMTADMRQKQTRAPIPNESGNGLKNVRGSIAMARTEDPASATSQFFINLIDNPNLDKSGEQLGYAVFGHVSSGMQVVDEIAQEPTARRQGHANVPTLGIVIESAKVAKATGDLNAITSKISKPITAVKRYYDRIKDKLRGVVPPQSP